MGKTVEVDEEELLRDRSLKETLAKIYKDPKARALVEQAHKIVEPTAATPTIDQQKAITEPVAAIEKQLADFLDAQAKEKAEREKQGKLDQLNRIAQDGFSRLRRDEGYTDEGIKAIEKLMEEKGILDPIDAAAIYERTNPPPIPSTPTGSGGWNFMEMPTDTSEDIKKLVETKGENMGVVDKIIRETLADVRGQSRR